MNKWLPSNKWWVATITAAGTIAGMVWVGDGINTDQEKLVLIALVVQRLTAYWASNDTVAAAGTMGRDIRGRFLKHDKAPEQ